MKVNLTFVKNNEERESKKINPKTDKPYTYFFCSIRCKELVDDKGEEIWYNGFGDDVTKAWEAKKLADTESTIEADIHVYDTKKEDKVFKNFKRTETLSEKEILQIKLDDANKKLEEKEPVKTEDKEP